MGSALYPWREAAAQRRIDPSSAIEVHHRAGKIFTGPRKDQSDIADVNRFEIRKGSKVAVIVADQNPLLFAYDVNVTEAETEQYKIAAQFATTLGSVLKPFQNALGGGAGNAVEVEGLNVKQFSADLDSINSYLSQVPAKLALSMGTSDDVARLKVAVAGWAAPALANRIRQGYERLAVVAFKCMSGQPLGTSTGETLSCVDPLDRARAAQAQPTGPVVVDTAAPAPIENTRPPKPGGANGGTPGKANTGAANSNGSTPPRPAVPTPSGPTIGGYASLALALQPRVEEASKVLAGFSSDVASINTPKTIADRVYGLKNQTVELSIKSSPKYDDFLDAATKAKRAASVRKMSIVLEPYTPVSLGLAPAAVLLFIKNPTYSAASAGSSFAIEEVDQDATLYNLAAMLTITPRAWDQPTFGGSFELGLSPTKDKIGLYAGAGISVQDLFIVGAGFAWQQVNQLAKGLEVGQTLASAEALKTEKKFKPGLYLHLTVK